MGKIDTSGWKEFRVGELFAQERGKEKAPKQNEPGDCPLIQETNNNNGFDRMVVPTKIIKGNSITVSINYAQNVFYQADDFCASVNIAVLRNSHLNRYNSQFVCSVLRNAHQKFDYTSKISKELLNKEMIMLPVDKTGQPDWAYMESYMANLETKVTKSLTLLQTAKDAEKKKVDTREWGKFRVWELFDIKHPAARSEKKYCEGEINYVSSGAFNNGVANKLMPLPNELLDRGGCITVSPLDGSSFYQEEDFLGRGGSGASISILYNSHLNRNNALFICSVIRSSANGFGYTDLLNGENLKSLTIKLPVDKTGQPDWEYMEEYMRKVEEKTENTLNQFMLV